jgi:transketolase
MTDIKHLQNFATQVRRDVLRMVHAVNSGHPGGSLGSTDFVTALYQEIMDYKSKPFSMTAENEDAFYLSNGHIAPMWYSILARSGFFPVKELSTLRKINSRLQGHPTTAEGLEGVRIASGSLGQGLSVALGHAEAKKLDGDSHLIYTLHGDGELDEGQIWEAALYAGAKGVDNIIATVDYNKKQIDGPTDLVMNLGNLAAKWKAFGWKVFEMNGNDMDDVLKVLAEAKDSTHKGQPIVVLMHTEMGAGVDFMMGTHKWHGQAPNDEQLEKALAQLPETLGDY